jgi:hypothetical protein
MGLSLKDHFVKVAVMPDWRDPSGLLGYVNLLAQPHTYSSTEALRLTGC